MNVSTGPRLVVDETSMSKEGASVVGPIYLDVDRTFFFPEERWTDLVVPIAMAWLEAVHRLSAGKCEEESVWFMDGPFSVVLGKTAPGIVELSFLRRGANGEESFGPNPQATIDDLLSNALSTAGACAANQWIDSDIRQLRGAVAKAKKYAGRSG